MLNPNHPSRAYVRVARYSSRPGHADQLHLDLWWRGLNVAQDAGTYRYNAYPPWENALAGSAIHNTVTVNGQDQMRRAGRFLWLDWAQGVVEGGEHSPDGAWFRLVASHDGYRRLGITHQREVTACPGGRWVIDDQLLQVGGSRLKVKPAGLYLKTFAVRLHWLLPDWPWRLDAEGQKVLLFLESPYGPVELRLSCGDAEPVFVENTGRARRKRYRLKTGLEVQASLKAQVVRAGEKLYGEGPVEPTWGWAAPTYGVKVPALSVAVSITTALPTRLTSEWIFPASDPSSDTGREGC